MIQTRHEISKSDRWNVEALYPSFEEWQKEFDQKFSAEKTPRWPELASYRGKLGDGTEVIKSALEKILSIQRELEKLFTYAHLRHDEDITNDAHKTGYQKIVGILHQFAQEASWVEPEILSLPEELVKSYLSDPELSEYSFHLEKILRVKDHTLTSDKEELLALAGKALQAPSKAFSAINDADFKFGKVKNSKGEEIEITHGSFALCIRDHDRVLRENAFKQYHQKFDQYENTICELLQGQVQSHIFVAKAKKYSSALEAALFPKNIPTTVYDSLIHAVNDNLDALHRYCQLRKKFLKLDELHLFDMYVPLTEETDIRMSFDEAIDVIVESVKPLGEEYENILYQGLKQDRWTDRYENQNKRSGAYSSGCYDSMPYILMNYKEILRDVFTLAHEAGHSMHSYLSHKNQPYLYGDYPIFLAEVASTFNEDLLTRLLLERAANDQEKIFLINQKIEDIRTTLFRQTMFAEFERQIHQLAESNIPLTPALLKTEFKKLNEKYFGKETIIDPEISIEWARIPHFYYNFYVYQYATGISAALALSDRVVNGGSSEREDYLSFLKGGCSKYPIDLLLTAGVDMRTPEPVVQAIGKFRHLIDQLEKLTESAHLALS